MFWGLAAMMAAELKFPDVQDGFSWLSLAQGVFNTQTARWDTTTCGGGLRWQLFPYQSGYTMKNSVSNGGLFQLAARLARYTDDDKYSNWAEKIWDWSVSSPLVDNKTWNVADSTQMANDCADSGNYQWTYNYGAYLMGAVYMYNYVSGSRDIRHSPLHVQIFYIQMLTHTCRQMGTKSGRNQWTASSAKL
jgi:mannan endo-1,6-alpha-mannosidase